MSHPDRLLLPREEAGLRDLDAGIDYVVGEPLHHHMEKEMCIGIAERAEGRAGQMRGEETGAA